MTQELGDSYQDISDSKILEVPIPQPLIETFQIANRFAQGNFYLVGSAVRSCILRDPKLPNDVDFLGAFDLEEIEAYFGNHVIGKSNPPGVIKVLQGDKEIDFLSFPNIRAKLEEMDITITLLCIDKNGVVYDPLHYIEDLRNRIIKIENADQKIQIEPWRIIRVLRFAATWEYEVEDLTRKACIKNIGLMDPKNGNTIYTLERLMSGDPEIINRTLAIAEEYGILTSINRLIEGRKYE